MFKWLFKKNKTDDFEIKAIHTNRQLLSELKYSDLSPSPGNKIVLELLIRQQEEIEKIKILIESLKNS